MRRSQSGTGVYLLQEPGDQLTFVTRIVLYLADVPVAIAEEPRFVDINEELDLGTIEKHLLALQVHLSLFVKIGVATENYLEFRLESMGIEVNREALPAGLLES